MVSFDFGAVNGIKEHGDGNDGKADRLVAADSLRVRRSIFDQLKQIFTDNTSNSGANGERRPGFKINAALFCQHAFQDGIAGHGQDGTTGQKADRRNPCDLK